MITFKTLCGLAPSAVISDEMPAGAWHQWPITVIEHINMCHAGSRTHSRDRSFAVLGYETCCRLRCVSWMNYIHAVGVYRRPICLIEAAMQSDILIPSPSVLAVFCNSLLCGVSDRLVRKLQSIENAASRLIIGARRCDHIMHTLHRLHWLHRSVHWRRFYFQLTRVHSVLELFEWCALQIYLLTTSYLVTSRLQNRTPDAPVAVWSGTGIFSWWHQPCRRQWPPPSPVNSQQDVCCPIYRVAQKSKLLSQYNSLLFLSYPVHTTPLATGRSARVEQSTVSVTTGHQLRTIQTTTEHISVRH